MDAYDGFGGGAVSRPREGCRPERASLVETRVGQL